jgi:cell wall-associated NlpC family hydrolase
VHVDPAILLGNIECYCCIVPVEDVLPGDLLVFTARRNPQHVAVLTTPETMIHAWDGVGAVKEHVITSAWWKLLHCGYRWGDW